MEDKELKRLAAVWALRALLRSGNLDRSQFEGFRGTIFDTFELIGMQQFFLDNLNELSNDDLLRPVLSSQLRQFEAQKPGRRGVFFRNLNLLGDLLGLSHAERQVLTFAIVLEGERGLQRAVEHIGEVSQNGLIHELSHLLEIKKSRLHQILEPQGPLAVSGLLTLDLRSRLEIPQRLEVLPGLDFLLRRANRGNDIISLLADYFSPAPGSRLTSSHFPHLKKDLRILFPFLQVALEKRLTGVNILFYGPPGTGKTELARLVAQDLGAYCYEVGHAQEARLNQERRPRLRSYLLCQRLLSRHHRGLILFDEAEDVFPLVIRARIIREGDEGTPFREFFEAKRGKKEAEKGWKEPQGGIFRQEPTGMVFQG